MGLCINGMEPCHLDCLTALISVQYCINSMLIINQPFWELLMAPKRRQQHTSQSYPVSHGQ